MPAFDVDLMIQQGETFAPQALEWSRAGVPVDLTACTARMQVRECADDSVVLLSLNTENGGITLQPDGRIALFMSDADTAALTWRAGVYDLEIVQAPLGRVRRLCQGAVYVSANVTR